MKRVPDLDLSNAACTLQSELRYRFRKYTDSNGPEYDPLFLIAAFIDPQYKLLLNPIQTNSAVLRQLKDISDSGESTSSSTTSSPVHAESDEAVLSLITVVGRKMERGNAESIKATSGRAGTSAVCRCYSSCLESCGTSAFLAGE